ncbi:hypothetical protein CHUAL_000218 [Chamberlinius hualienensis]
MMFVAVTVTYLLLFRTINGSITVKQLMDKLNQVDLLTQWLTNGLPMVPKEASLDTEQIANYYGYKLERHIVPTEDGYLLELHRIPAIYRNSSAHPVLVQHGFMGSSVHFVINGKTDSLAFALSDAGYDVWLGNFRGNIYSRRHLVLSPDSNSSFWNYSLDELSQYDLPSMIDYIRQTTNQPTLSFVGHSMGSTTAAMMLTKKHHYCYKLKRIVWLAPVLYGTYAKTALRILVSQHQTIRSLLDLVYGTEVFWAPRWVKDLMASLCVTQTGKFVCELLISTIFGFSEDLLNREFVPVLFAHSLEGTSWHVILHFIQIFIRGHMVNYDWGPKMTGHRQEVFYRLSDIRCHVNVFWGKMDPFTDDSDFKRMAREMKQVTIEEVLTLNSKYWSHLDFILSKNARNHHYKKLIDLID